MMSTFQWQHLVNHVSNVTGLDITVCYCMSWEKQSIQGGPVWQKGVWGGVTGFGQPRETLPYSLLIILEQFYLVQPCWIIKREQQGKCRMGGPSCLDRMILKSCISRTSKREVPKTTWLAKAHQMRWLMMTWSLILPATSRNLQTSFNSPITPGMATSRCSSDTVLLYSPHSSYPTGRLSKVDHFTCSVLLTSGDFWSFFRVFVLLPWVRTKMFLFWFDVIYNLESAQAGCFSLLFLCLTSCLAKKKEKTITQKWLHLSRRHAHFTPTLGQVVP